MVFFFLYGQPRPGYAYYLVCEYLCELGIGYYKQGKIDLATSEFRKALLANPDYEPALKYLAMIAGEENPAPDAGPAEEQALQETAGEENAGQIIQPAAAPRYIPAPPSAKSSPAETPGKESLSDYLDLNKPAANLKFPVEIEKGSVLTIRGTNISRYLITKEGLITVNRPDSGRLLVSGDSFGYTYLHVWDKDGRKTLEFLVIPQKPKGPTFEESLRTSEEKARNFKFRYSWDWSTFESGRRLHSLDRQYYSYSHNLSLTGDTPYGNFDSAIIEQTLNSRSELSFFTIGLENGYFQGFKGFSFRVFDFTPAVSNLAYGGSSLRGIQFRSPAFEEKFDYEVFWGKEKESGFAGLSSGQSGTIDSLIEGVNLNYSPGKREKYSVALFHGYGSEREDWLQPYGSDVKAHKGAGNWDFDYESAYDGANTANYAKTGYSGPRVKITEELRNISSDFVSLTGQGANAGEYGSLSTVTLNPRDSYSLNARLDVYRDRLYPSQNDPGRWNEDLSVEDNWEIDRLSRLRLDYTMQDQRGKLSEIRTHNAGAGYYRTLEWFRKFNNFIIYRHQDNEYFNSPGLSYVNDKINFGTRVKMIDELYYFVNKEYNWTDAEHSGEKAHPSAFETGLDWSGRLGKGPFSLRLTLTWRDEENADSQFSFLSGEDYLETFAELSCRPAPEVETFLNARVRDVWADNPNAVKRMELSMNAGMRYLWDTGIRWDSVGMVEGYVFKDYNFDGLKQADEPAIPGIKIWLGKNQSRLTNERGYYLFPKARGRSVTLSIDQSSIPPGFVLTGPAIQKAPVLQGGFSTVNFGLASRTEIQGIIFEDKDADGKFSLGDVPLRKAVVLLENGQRSASDSTGKYIFNRINKGRHKISLDLRSIPAQYIPTVSIYKEIDLTEGTSYVHNFPLKKARSE